MSKAPMALEAEDSAGVPTVRPHANGPMMANRFVQSVMHRAKSTRRSSDRHRRALYSTTSSSIIRISFANCLWQRTRSVEKPWSE